MYFRTQCSVRDSWSARSVLPGSFPRHQLSFSENELGSKSDENFLENISKRLPSSFSENESWCLGNEPGSTLLADQESLTEHWVLKYNSCYTPLFVPRLLCAIICQASFLTSVQEHEH